VLYIKIIDYRLPFWLTIFSSLLPIFANLLIINNQIITYITSIVAFSFAINRKSIYINKEFILLISLVVFYLIFVLFLNKGIGSGGTLIVIGLTLTFFQIFNPGLLGNDYKINAFLKLISFIYKFHIVCLYLELIIVLLGYQYILVELFSRKLSFIGYKDYNHAHFLRYLGFDNVTGLGGLLMGSQSAGMVSVSALVLFVTMNSSLKNWRLWALLSFASFLFNSNMTSALMLLSAVFLLIYIFKSSYNKRLFKIVFLAGVPLLAPLVFYKIDNPSELDTYLRAFLPPVHLFVKNFVSGNFLDLLFGYGVNGHIMLQGDADYGTDFGLLALVNQAGIFLFLICFITVYRMNRSAFIITNKKFKSIYSDLNPYRKLVFHFYILNIILVDIWLLSLIHYTTAVETGGREFFAIHLSLAILLRREVFYEHLKIKNSIL
jgi:hypothetical protein